MALFSTRSYCTWRPDLHACFPYASSHSVPSTLTTSGVRIGLRASVLNVRTAEAGGQYSLMPSRLTTCTDFPKRFSSSAEALRHVSICSGDNCYPYGLLLLLIYVSFIAIASLQRVIFAAYIFPGAKRPDGSRQHLINGERQMLYSHLAGVRILLLLK